MNNYNTKLQSENIDYVEVNENLIDDYLLMVNNEEIQKQISTKRRIYTYEDELNWVKQKKEENAVIFSMIERQSGKFIGNVEFMEINNGEAEIGITITPFYQNKHYGTEAMKTIIDYGFNVMNLEKINLVVFSNNKRAIHCYKNLGFIEYDVEKNVAVIDNESIDDIYMTLKR
ncbi:MAG: GNAT family N-acetyltransferase [Lactobacillales bacterium]|nr:GNAT family N-acetyltransferase [Lactobacillales bacterium]